MSGIALGAAFAAVQLVHRAHSKVKTSKARCARLVERCQLVIDRLERIAPTEGGDAILRERVHQLERAFEQTAQTIVQVGQQGVIASLLQSEANALRIASCNEALTELISLFNLEEIVDVRRWQTELEVARVRDHHELLSMGQRIESGNAAINRELAQQGATIAEVLRVIHDINAGLQSAHFTRETLALKIAIPLTLADAAGPPPTSPITAIKTTLLPKAKAIIGSGLAPAEPSSALCITCISSGLSTAAAAAEAAKSRSSAPPPRRLSITQKCAKMVPLANVFSKLSSSFPFSSSSHSLSRGPAAAAAVAATRPTRDSPCGGRSPVVEPRSTSACGGVLNGKGDSGSSASSCSPLPAEPPPPYQLRVANPAPEYDYGPATRSSSRFTAASVEAVRAPDSPVPTFPSPKLSTESVFGSSQSLASLSFGVPEPRCTRRSSTAGAGPPVLRRKNTIGFGRRMTLSSD